MSDEQSRVKAAPERVVTRSMYDIYIQIYIYMIYECTNLLQPAMKFGVMSYEKSRVKSAPERVGMRVYV